MSDIFLSYSREDRDRVAPLVDYLVANGLDVWWDRDINPGDSFEESIDKHILDADCVVVVWSSSSVDSRWVKNEALEGMERDILVPIQLDEVRIPVAFKQTQVANFTLWPSSVDEFEAQSFLSAVFEKLNRPAPAPDSNLLPKKSARLSQPMALITLFFLAILMVITAYWYIGGAVNETNRKVAVLRFENISKKEDSFLADSLSSELSARLKPIKGLNLVSQFASWDIPDELSPKEIAERLRVNYVLDGKILITGSTHQLRITLSNKGGDLIWQREYKASPATIQQLTRRIADHLSNELNIPTTVENDEVISRIYTTNDAAYKYYLLGSDLLRQSSEQDVLGKAKVNFNNAIQEDSRFARSYSGLCRVHIRLYEGNNSAEDFEAAERACNRALTLQSTDSDAYIALSNLYLYSGQEDLAESQIREAIRLDPDNVDAYLTLGRILHNLKKPTEALAAYNQAVSKQPGYWRSFNARGIHYYRLGEYPQAIADFTQVAFLDPTNTSALNNLGTARYLNGEFSAAIASWRKSEAIKPNRTALSNIGTGYYYLRDFQQAANMYTKAIEATPNDHRLWGNLADAQRMAEKNAAARTNYLKAIDLAESALVINDADPLTSSRLAVYYASIGKPEKARANLQRTETLGGANPYMQYDITVALVLLGDQQKAQYAYKNLLESGFPIAVIEAEPIFESLKQSSGESSP
jgi:Flp pilus assembly protein TadD/TolB-like protein